MLIVDESKCRKDGICASECPTAIIKLKDKQNHYPMMLGYPRARYFRLPERKPAKVTFR